MMTKALLTGVTGQDGSYLAELLLAKGYEVHGLIRRASSFNTARLDPIYRDPHEAGVRFLMHYGDLSDSGSLVNLIRDLEPDEVYHLGAQSHVKVSFEIPEYTADATAMGTIRLLEAIRASGVETRFYQAGSSEMFGLAPPPQNERTPFHPRSPYGVSKVFAHWATINYREAYGMFACNGILFNHECLPADTPVVVRRSGYVDVVAIGEIVPHPAGPAGGKRYVAGGGGYEVWDGEAWTPCTARTATWHDEEIVTLRGRGAVVEATKDHVVFTAGGAKAAGEVRAGDRLRLAAPPDVAFRTVLSEEEAWFLGVMAAEGRVSRRGSGRIECGDEEVLGEAARAWEAISAGRAVKDGSRPTATLELRGNAPYLRMLRHELYGREGAARVPKRVLNATPDLQVAFLAGYRGDVWPRGAARPPRSLRARSPALAAGLVFLARSARDEPVAVSLEARRTYLLDVAPGEGREDVRHAETRPYRGWMCDLATQSGRFAAGVGLVVVHNSPRRGETFVTRKITRAVARIKAEIQDKLYLGNLDARRDWGYAPEYVDAMWRMLQQDEPDDFVVATGESHTVREFCELAFAHAGLGDYRDYVAIDPNYYRPAEVHVLEGDATKAREVLGWEPRVRFSELVRLMVDADVRLLDDELSGRLVRQDRDH